MAEFIPMKGNMRARDTGWTEGNSGEETFFLLITILHTLHLQIKLFDSLTSPTHWLTFLLIPLLIIL